MNRYLIMYVISILYLSDTIYACQSTQKSSHRTIQQHKSPASRTPSLLKTMLTAWLLLSNAQPVSANLCGKVCHSYQLYDEPEDYYFPHFTIKCKSACMPPHDQYDELPQALKQQCMPINEDGLSDAEKNWFHYHRPPGHRGEYYGTDLRWLCRIKEFSVTQHNQCGLNYSR